MSGSSFLPPWLTLLGCLGFIAWLFWKDSSEPAVGSNALWISGIWLFIEGSRTPGSWIYVISGGYDVRNSQLEGNPLDEIILSALMLSSIVILNRRRFQWSAFFASNLTVWAIYIYFLISAVWGADPLVVVKRITKDFGLVFLVLLIATEPNWSYAIRKIFLRVSYIIFPLSVVLIKWFPSIGRSASSGGETMYGGVTVHKNTLGQELIVFGIVLIWDLAEHLFQQKLSIKDSRVVRRLLVLATCGWLLATINCSTAIALLPVGIFLYWLTGCLLKTRAPRTSLFLCIMAAVVLYAFDATFKIKETIIESLGRNMTLTGRTVIWEVVRSQPNNPLIGGGYYMFWDSNLGTAAKDELGMRLNTAHNGYLEVFLDGGIVGISLLFLMLATRGLAIFNRFGTNAKFARMAVIYFGIALLYNFSESNFFRLGSLWMMTLMAMLSIPRVNPLGEDEGFQAKFG